LILRLHFSTHCKLAQKIYGGLKHPPHHSLRCHKTAVIRSQKWVPVRCSLHSQSIELLCKVSCKKSVKWCFTHTITSAVTASHSQTTEHIQRHRPNAIQGIIFICLLLDKIKNAARVKWCWRPNYSILIVQFQLPAQMFLKEVSYAHQDSIYLIKNTVKTVIMWNIISI